MCTASAMSSGLASLPSGMPTRNACGEPAMVCSAASPRPCTRNPPSVFTLCGVKPICAITGMPAADSTAIWSAIRSPPSSLTACTPASFMNRVAAASAASGPAS